MSTLTQIVSGENPKLLLLSGMHGDESEVIAAVRYYVQTHKRMMPAFVYIPEVSPSAVVRHVRNNCFDHDVNRSFYDPPQDDEVREVMDLLTPYQFNLAINFHEDPDYAHTFYLYDTGTLSFEQLNSLRTAIVATGAGLHTGTDDPLDANLGYHIEKGYISTPYDMLPQDAGFSWIWFAKHGITKRDIDIEVPGKASFALKQALVNVVFTFFLTPAFGF